MGLLKRAAGRKAADRAAQVAPAKQREIEARNQDAAVRRLAQFFMGVTPAIAREQRHVDPGEHRRFPHARPANRAGKYRALERRRARSKAARQARRVTRARAR